jgi:hypothetical protein
MIKGLNNQMKEKTKVITVMSLLLISFISVVSAYGIASPYWIGHPMEIAPGDTQTVSITIQNVEEKDIIIDVSLKEGEELADINEGRYTVPAGSIDTEILVTIKAPEESDFGESHRVTISSREVISGDTGGVALGTAFETSFDVIIANIPKTQKESPVLAIVLGALILITIFSAYFIKKRKSRK